MKTLAIGMVSDERYIMNAAVAIYSAVCNVKDRDQNHISIYFVDAGITSNSKKRLERVVDHLSVDLTWINADFNLVSELSLPEWQNVATYGRFFIPPYVEQFTDHDRLLYLDADIIVYDDISQLWDVDLTNHRIAAVQSYEEPTVGDRDPDSMNYYIRLGYDKSLAFFNAGVLLLNIRDNNWSSISNDLIEAGKKSGGEVALADQDCLNIIFANEWKKLDPRWNVCYFIGRGDTKDKISKINNTEVSIMHYVGGSIDIKDASVEHPSQTYFLHSLSKSQWFIKYEYILWYTKFNLLKSFYTIMRNPTVSRLTEHVAFVFRKYKRTFR
jgi:lipopolysaccharide biosynthesis glycosyltransferase